ncbi:MAG: RNA polymerase sigma factor [Actinomycetota bacterium]
MTTMIPRFETFFESHRALVYRYLLARVGRNEADDCFQETFISALRAYPRLTPESRLKPWVLKIAERKAIDAGRRAARRASPSGDLPDIAAAEGPPVEGFELWGAVRGLPHKQARAIALRFAGDLAYAELAAAMGISEEAARQNVRQGLKKLREVVPR